jgi:hypothetical protein
MLAIFTQVSIFHQSNIHKYKPSPKPLIVKGFHEHEFGGFYIRC